MVKGKPTVESIVFSKGYKLIPYLLYTLSTLLVVLAVISLLGVNGVNFWITITSMGDEAFYVALLPVVYLLVSRDLGFKLILLFMTSAWINIVLKSILAMPRPPRELWLVPASGYGFPSGHTQSATVFWGYLSYRFRMIPFTIFTVVIVSLIAYSRVYLGVHYPHDVIGGLTIGLLLLLLAYTIEYKLGNVLRLTYRLKVLMVMLYSLLLLPIYYTVNSLLIVKVAGLILGGGLGHIIVYERLKVREEPILWRRMLVTVIGMLSVFLCYYTVRKFTNPLIVYSGFTLIGLTITFIPLILRHLSEYIVHYK